MFAEIITIGDELLIGQVVDTNSAWIGQKLNKIGIEVLRIVSIRDREDEILEAIDNAMKRVNIVLVTGGLGARDARRGDRHFAACDASV